MDLRVGGQEWNLKIQTEGDAPEAVWRWGLHGGEVDREVSTAKPRVPDGVMEEVQLEALFWGVALLLHPTLQEEAAAPPAGAQKWQRHRCGE